MEAAIYMSVGLLVFMFSDRAYLGNTDRSPSNLDNPFILASAVFFRN